MRGDRIRQLSTDHTWIQEALDSGLLTPDQVEGHPNRHVIRRYLGAPQPPNIDFRLCLTNGESDQQALQNQGMILKPADRLLLCSDGLTDLVSDAEILEAFDNKTAEVAVESLIDLANQRGGHDNITVISVEIPVDIPVKTKKRSPLPIGCAIVAIVLGLLVIAASAYFMINGFPWQAAQSTPTPPIQSTINPLITSAPQSSSTAANFYRHIHDYTAGNGYPNHPGDRFSRQRRLSGTCTGFDKQQCSNRLPLSREMARIELLKGCIRLLQLPERTTSAFREILRLLKKKCYSLI